MLSPPPPIIFPPVSYTRRSQTTNLRDEELRSCEPEDMTDSELRAALELHHSESYGWALNCCARSSVEAEAVLQTVYLKVLMGKARYHGKASFKTWLFAVIRRTAADERRRQMLRHLLLDRHHKATTLGGVE